MKKYFVSAAAVLLIVSAACAFFMNASKTDSLFEANVEALAEVEQDGSKVCFNDIVSAEGLQVRYCPICDFVPGDKDIWTRKGSCR